MCTSNLVSHIKRTTQTLGVREWGAKEDMRTYVGGSDRRMREKLPKEELRDCTVHRVWCGSQMEEDGIWRARQMAHTECWHGNERGRGHLEDTVLDERIILKWIWRNLFGMTWSALEYGQVACCCQHGNETECVTWLAEELLASEETVYSEVSWIVTNKFNLNELRSYRGNIVTGLPLQEWHTPLWHPRTSPITSHSWSTWLTTPHTWSQFQVYSTPYYLITKCTVARHLSCALLSHSNTED
jgi:hypothetical protein